MDLPNSVPLESLIDHLTKLSDELSQSDESKTKHPFKDDRDTLETSIKKTEKDTNNES